MHRLEGIFYQFFFMSSVTGHAILRTEEISDNQSINGFLNVQNEFIIVIS
jgi:hypothetical protein